MGGYSTPYRTVKIGGQIGSRGNNHQPEEAQNLQ